MSLKLICMLYCNFNEKNGLEVLYQNPPDLLEREDFLKFSAFLLPYAYYSEELTIVFFGDAYLIGYPCRLKSQTYIRGQFEFNFCIVVKREEYEESRELYEKFVIEINRMLRQLELEKNYTFLKHNLQLLISFFDDLYKQFQSGNNKIQYESKDEEGIKIAIDLKTQNDKKTILKLKADFNDKMIPIVFNEEKANNRISVDDAYKKVIENINGVNSLGEISNKISIDVKQLFSLIDTLMKEGVIKILSNEYNNTIIN